MSIEWNVSYAVGFDLIDDQHRELFRKVNELVEAMHHANGRERVGDVIRFLGDYVVHHFGTEESLMAQHHFPGYAVHHREHTDFIATLQALREDLLRQGPTAALAIDVNNKVCNWLVTHVLATDKTLGAFLRTRA
jgi:hemerythrin